MNKRDLKYEIKIKNIVESFKDIKSQELSLPVNLKQSLELNHFEETTKSNHSLK